MVLRLEALELSGKPGHGSRDADIDADHAGVKAAFEFVCGIAATCENGSTVTEVTLIADGDCFVQAARPNYAEHGAEDFLASHPHVCLNAIDNARANQEPVRFEVAAPVERSTPLPSATDRDR